MFIFETRFKYTNTDKLRLISPAEGVYLPSEDRKIEAFYLFSLQQKHDQITFLLKRETQAVSKPLSLRRSKQEQTESTVQHSV